MLMHLASDSSDESGADETILWPKQKKDKSSQVLLTSQNFLALSRGSEVRDPKEQQLSGWLASPEIACDRNQENLDQN